MLMLQQLLLGWLLILTLRFLFIYPATNLFLFYFICIIVDFLYHSQSHMEQVSCVI